MALNLDLLTNQSCSTARIVCCMRVRSTSVDVAAPAAIVAVTIHIEADLAVLGSVSTSFVAFVSSFVLILGRMKITSDSM